MQVQRRTGVYLRVLYDTLFGFLPGAKQLLEAAGGVKGTLGNCETLMSEVLGVFYGCGSPTSC